MNIGIVTTWFERGAAYVSQQYKRILDSEFNVYIFARAGEQYAIGEPNWDSEQITWAKTLPFVMKTAFDLKDFRKWITKNAIELVIFNEQHWWPPIVLCNEMGVKTVAYIDYYTEETVPLFDCYDMLICNTQRHYSVFNWHRNCVYIPWGTDVSLFDRKSTGLVSADTVTFFHSCGMNPTRKGTDLLLQAFATLRGTSQLIIHSQVNLKALMPALASTIDELVSNNRLQIKEETIPAPGLYHLGDVYVYPTRLEGIGLTVIEAIACGLPVITTDCPPMNEFVMDGVTGRLVRVEKFVARADGYYWPQSIVNLDSLRECLKFYVDRKDLLSSQQASVREYALIHLDWFRNAHNLNKIIGEVKKRPDSELADINGRVLRFENRRTNLLQRYPRVSYLFSQVIGIARRVGTSIL